eukprot:1537783-Pyramimonas_sp.AAC.1
MQYTRQNNGLGPERPLPDVTQLSTKLDAIISRHKSEDGTIWSLAGNDGSRDELQQQLNSTYQQWTEAVTQ